MPAGEGVVVDEDVTRLEVLLAEAVDDRPGAQFERPKMYGDPHGGGDQAAFAVEERRGEVEHLVEDGVIRGALENLGHLEGDGLQQASQDSEGEGVAAPARRAARIAAGAHSASSTIRVPNRSTVAVSPGGSTVVVSICSTMAGPAITLPAASRDRS